MKLLIRTTKETLDLSDEILVTFETEKVAIVYTVKGLIDKIIEDSNKIEEKCKLYENSNI